MSAIEDLERKVQSLQDKLRAAKKALQNAKLAAAPVKVGDIVVTQRGTRHRVCHVDVRMSGRPWVSGNPERKDGSFGTAVRYLYDDWKIES